MSDSLQPRGLYNPWNSPGQNTGVGSLSLPQGIFPTQGLNPGLSHCRWILYQLSHREAQEYWSGKLLPSPGDLPNPGIEPRSLALQVDSLPTEPQGSTRTVPEQKYIYLLRMDVCILSKLHITSTAVRWSSGEHMLVYLLVVYLGVELLGHCLLHTGS